MVAVAVSVVANVAVCLFTFLYYFSITFIPCSVQPLNPLLLFVSFVSLIIILALVHLGC